MTKSEALFEAAVRADVEEVGILVVSDGDGVYFTIREDAEIGPSDGEVALYLVSATPMNKGATA